MNKTVSLLLAVLLLLSLLASCGESKTNSGDEANPADNAAQTPVADDAAEPEETEDLYASLPSADYGGSDFPLLQYEETSAATSTICVEEMNGEAVNDAIFQRTVNVSERLGVNIVFTKTSLSDVNSVMSTSVTAGDDYYQAFWQHSTNAVTNFLQKGYVLKMNDISAFDFSAPWWNRNTMDSIRLNDRIYMAFGDINYYLFDFQSIIICNKPFIEDHNMTDPYTLVQEGEWTIDTFLAMVEEGAVDLDGNGKLGEAQDRIGFTGFKTATELGFTHAADVELFSRGEDGSVTYDGVSEKYFDVVSRYSAVLGDKNYAEHNGDYLGRFRNDLTLFTSCSVGELSTMRDTEFDYLVLPFPKYDTAQANYISFITNQIQPMMIPITVADTERAGVVLENLCGESHKLVRERYFDELVNYKYVRDSEAINILRMLYSSDARFEIGHIYNWGGVEETIVAGLTGQGEQFISKMERSEKIMSKSMQKTLDAISD